MVGINKRRALRTPGHLLSVSGDIPLVIDDDLTFCEGNPVDSKARSYRL